jgi:hypothetical protein
VLFNLSGNTINYTYHQDDYERSNGAITEEEILGKQTEWQGEEDVEMLRQLHVRWAHFEQSLPNGCKCNERLLFEQSIGEVYGGDSLFEQPVSVAARPRSATPDIVRSITPDIVEADRSPYNVGIPGRRRVMVSEMVPGGTGFTGGDAGRHAHGGRRAAAARPTNLSPIMSPRESILSDPETDTSAPPTPYAHQYCNQAGRHNHAPSPSTPPQLEIAPALPTTTSFHPAVAPVPAAAANTTTTDVWELLEQARAETEQFRAELRRSHQALAARDYKLQEALSQLEQNTGGPAVASATAAANTPLPPYPQHQVATSDKVRRKHRWLPSLGRKSKHSAAAGPAPSIEQHVAPMDAAAEGLEDEDAMLWDSTIQYLSPGGTDPTRAVAAAAALNPPTNTRFASMDSSRLSVLGPATSMMQQALADAEQNDWERQAREEEAMALVEQKAAARMAARVRRTVAAAPEHGSTGTDVALLAQMMRGGGGEAGVGAGAASAAPATNRPLDAAGFKSAKEIKAEARQQQKAAEQWTKDQKRLQKKQMKESARWAKEQAQIQKREAKERAKQAKAARSRAQKETAAGGGDEPNFSTVEGEEVDLGMPINDMWESDTAWRTEVELLQREDPEMLADELAARDASLHERSPNHFRPTSRAGSVRSTGSANLHKAASFAPGDSVQLAEWQIKQNMPKTLPTRSASTTTVPKKRFQWGLSFLRRSRPATETSGALNGVGANNADSGMFGQRVIEAKNKPKRRWSFAPKFSFLRKKKTGAAASIAERAEAARAGAECITASPMGGGGRGQESPLSNADLEALWQTLNPSPARKVDVSVV